LGCGVHGFTLLGIMGEAPKLTAEESLSVVERVVRRAQGRQVIVGASHAGLENVRRLAHEVMAAGAAGVMVAPPSGLKGDDGVYNYFAQLFKELGPDIPVSAGLSAKHGRLSRTSVFGAWSTISKLVMLKHEDAPGCQAHARARRRDEARTAASRSWWAMAGSCRGLRRGADGAMTGAAWPEMLVQVCRLFAAGRRGGRRPVRHLFAAGAHEQQPAIRLALRRGAVPARRDQVPAARAKSSSPPPIVAARWAHRAPRAPAASGEAPGRGR
jgi:4-hydroxy-tetrahydrodipicolinate synthase